MPLPDELIAHVFSFLEPAVLFRDTLSLNALVVDKCSTALRGHYTTISAALRAARPATASSSGRASTASPQH